MLVKDVMTWNVITVPSNTPVLEAERLMEAQRFARLPVVDKGRLVGIVTKDDLLRSGPSQATSFSRGELLYLLSKLTVKEIMKKDVVTVDMDTPIERAVAIAQSKHVGCLVVMDKKRVAGILTTNDVFYKILNPLLGIGEKGAHIIVYGAGIGEPMQTVIGLINKAGIKIKSVFNVKSDRDGISDLILQLDTDDVTELVSEINDLGFASEYRTVK
jgi:acetoin utilization protein AcuB